MPKPHRVDCEVVVGPHLAMGIYSNAFRVQDGENGRCLLEFLVFSENENQAQVMVKVPVRKSFLPVIRDNIDACLEPQGRTPS